MKISNALILKTIALVALGGASACQTSTAISNAANTSSNNANITRTETNTANKAAVPEAANKEPEKTSTVSLATPTEAYKFAYKARKNKDLDGLKKVMSKDALEFFAIFSDGGSPDDGLRQMTETPQAATDETRNEKITGETATLEYPDAQGKWKTMDFVRENGEWKLTFPKADSPGGKK